jgi:hypothetical protein
LEELHQFLVFDQVPQTVQRDDGKIDSLTEAEGSKVPEHPVALGNKSSPQFTRPCDCRSRPIQSVDFDPPFGP